MPSISLEILKLNQLFDEAKQAWFDVYQAPGLEGAPITATVPREEQDPEAVSRHLLRNGATLAGRQERRDPIAAAIASIAPIVHQAGRTGWREDGKAFVSHLHVAGVPEGGPQLIPPEGSISGAAGQLQARGNLSGWRKCVRVAQHSTAIITSLCATFAAPLMRPTKRPSFAIVLVAPSRSGKSSAQLVGASAMGFGTEEDLPNLVATPAGMSAASLLFNDHALPLNEVGTVRGAKRDLYTVLRDHTYGLMGGRDVLRHPSWAGTGGAVPSTFQVLPVLSSEHSPDAWAARNGETRDEGETARLIGVPVLFNGKSSIFDRPPPGMSEAELSTWESAQYAQLREGLPQQRGVAFSAYLDRLVQDPEGVTKRALASIAYFERRVGKPTMSPVARDIVGKFGVLYAGGMLAIRFGILPLTMKDVGNGMKRACLAAIAELPDRDGDLRADLRVLKEHLASGAVISVESSTSKELRLVRSADGFKRKKDAGWEYVIRAQVFAGWFGTPLGTRSILEWLDNEGFLEHARKRTLGRSNEWAQQQVTWPDGTRQRSVSLYLPNGPDDLEHQ